MILGIDVASYQGDPNYDQVRAAGFGFVFSKLTEGAGYVNPYAARTRAEAGRLGLGLGLYHFADGGDPVAEAGHFLAAAGGLETGTVLALDWEVEHFAGDPVAWCLTWLQQVLARTGCRPLLYIDQAVHNDHDWTPVVANGFGLWLAVYDMTPGAVPAAGAWPVVAIKQYSNVAVVPGVVGHVDADVFYGTLDSFRAYGYHPQVAPAPAPAPVPAPAPAPAPAPQPWLALPDLAYGQTSTGVLHLQQFLVRCFPSYASFRPTGFYGDATAASVAEFQRRSGIAGGDGRNVGPQTKRALWAAGYRG